jgi:hypothetical protein
VKEPVAAITDAQRRALDVLAPVLDASTYLAGGVAVALRLAHRSSRDLDLFVPRGDPAVLADALGERASELRITGRSAGTLHVEVLGVPASVLRYAYPDLEAHEKREDLPVPLASVSDLVCMKLSAIAGRGAAKDFWDLHAMLQARGMRLAEALALFRRKYVAEDIGHVVRSLAYFADAESAPMPAGLTPEGWIEIRSDMERWVKAL